MNNNRYERKKTSDNLVDTIQLLEEKQALQLNILKEQFYVTYESLKPINFIKDTLRDIAKTPDITNGIEDSIIGFATGYLTKKVIVGKTMNPIKNIAGVLFQIGVTNVVSNHSERIKMVGKQMFNMLTKSIKK